MATAAATNSEYAEEYYYGQESSQQHWSTPAIQRVSKQNSNILPVWKNEETMNLNHLVLQNIRISLYFKNKLSTLATFHEVIDELYYNVTHLEPWERGTHRTAGQTGMCGGVRGVGAGGVVSTPFCIMYKLFTLKLTRKQVVAMINHTDSPYIRGLGFLYIRFCQPPETFWEWYEPYFDDEEEIDPKAGGGDNMTMGQLVKLLLTKLDWYGTLFPRIPVPIQKEIDQLLREYNMKKFEEAKQEREAIEAMRNPGPQADVARKPEERSPKRYENRERERVGSRRESPSKTKRSHSRSKRSRSPTKHSRHRSGSRLRHKDRRSRSRSPKRPKRSSEQRSERKYSRSKSTDSKRRRSSIDRHEHKKHKKHRHHHRHHRSHRSRHEGEKETGSKERKEDSRKRSADRSESPKEFEIALDRKRDESRTDSGLPQREEQKPVSSDIEQQMKNGRNKDQVAVGDSRNDDDAREEGELVDESFGDD